MLEQFFNFRALLVTAPVFLFSLSLHEFFHAWTADRLGDTTARYSGRLTLNPFAHYDPVGTTLGLLFRVFGWAKPVPVNPAAFRWPKRDMMLTALGGPAVNFALALLFGIAFKLLQLPGRESLGAAAPILELAEKMAAYGIFLNLALGIFNLIPLHPLDGHHILCGLLSYEAALAYDRTKYIGSYVLLALILLSFSGVGMPIVTWPILFIMELGFSHYELGQLSEVLSPLLA